MRPRKRGWPSCKTKEGKKRYDKKYRAMKKRRGK